MGEAGSPPRAAREDWQMIWALMRRDEGLRPHFGYKAFALGLLIANIIGLRAGYTLHQDRDPALTPGSLEFLLLTAMMWGILSLFVLFTGGAVRCKPFDMALPIPARQMWIARIVAMMSVIFLCIAVVLIVLAAAEPLVGLPHLFNQGVATLALYVVVGVLLVVAVLQSDRPHLNDLAADSRFRWRAFVSLTGILALILAGASLVPSWGWLPLLGAALALLYRTYHALPRAFTLAPRAGNTAPARALAADAAAGAAAWTNPETLPGVGAGRSEQRGLPTRTILRALYPFATDRLMALPLLLVIGFYSALLSGIWVNIGAVQAVWVWAFCVLFFAAPTSLLYRFDALPIARARLFHYIALPALLVVVVCYVGGRVVSEARRAQEPLVGLRLYEPQGGDPWLITVVPGHFFEIAPDGNVPELEAPWGERHDAYAVKPIDALDVTLYSPYSLAPDATPRFAAWQLSRAIEAIYGERIAPAQLQERYLRARADGSAGLKPAGFTLLEDYPHLRPHHRMQILPFGLVWILVPALWLSGRFAGRLASAAQKPRKRALVPLVLLGPIIVVALFVAGALSQIYDPDFINAWGEIVARHLVASLPGGMFGLVLATGIAIAGAYRYAQQRVAQAEIPVAE